MKSVSRSQANAPEHPFARVHVDDPQGAELLSLCLRAHLARRGADQRPLVIVCVGTDRSTGDAYGPLVGTRLKSLLPPHIQVFGTLDQPVHATNLKELTQQLERKSDDPLILGVDACLGRSENVGFISVKDQPLLPGTGVNKQLPPVGEMHIVGIVNVGGFMEYLVLQSTRLHLVMRMAEVTANAIAQAVAWQFDRSPYGRPLPAGTPAGRQGFGGAEGLGWRQPRVNGQVGEAAASRRTADA